MAAISTCCSTDSGGNSPDPGKAMRDMFGPGGVDQQIRQAISTCWMLMAEGKRTPDAVSTEIRRIVERALTNLAEDAQAFGFTSAS